MTSKPSAIDGEGSPLPWSGKPNPVRSIGLKNVAGHRHERSSLHGFLDPQIMVNLAGRPEVSAVADAAEQRLRRVCDGLGGSNTKST
ncbi:MAG: hypothetical protein ABI433_07475 [Burkholderiaceae bacterium]